MLKEISIRDVVLIEKLDLELQSGFIALTGETGAGKSILIDALGLALGERADKGLVRNNSQRAVAGATFDISQNELVKFILNESDIEFENDELVLRRSVGIDGKSRAFANDVPVSLAVVRKLTAALLEIHGQHSAIGLMDVSKHIEMLDIYLCAHNGDFLEKQKALANAYSVFKDKEKAFDEAQKALGKSGAERDYLAHVLVEIERLAPIVGEDKELDEKRRFLMGSERIVSAIKEADDLIQNGKVEAILGNAARAISKIGRIEGDAAAKLNALLENATNSLEKSQTELAECLGYLQSAGHNIDLDPKELEHIEERLFALRGMARKHNVGVEQLPALLTQTKAKLEAIDNSDIHFQKAKGELGAALKEYQYRAKEMSKARNIGAKQLEAAIMAELPPLKLEKMKFRCAIESDLDRVSVSGFDKVRFEIAPNPGAGFAALDAIASGGELSRLSLALKLVLSEGNGTLALVFDEVDQGIGGATADAVGKRLRTLAKNAQVICVTHSPQVAARAHFHLRIEKTEKDGQTTTNVRPLKESERETEIARMLSGEDITNEAKLAAISLLKQGQSE